MSFEEKRAWIYGVITLAVPVVYLLTMLGRCSTQDVGDIEYVGPLVIAVAIAVALNIAADILAALASPGDAGLRDERDHSIRRRAQFVEYYALVVGVVAALGLVMAQFEHFWIAHMIYAAFALSSLLGAVTRIVAYRR